MLAHLSCRPRHALDALWCRCSLTVEYCGYAGLVPGTLEVDKNDMKHVLESWIRILTIL